MRLVLHRLISEEASSLPDLGTEVIPEGTAEHDDEEPGRQQSNVAVPSLALDKMASRESTSVSAAAQPPEGKGDSGVDTGLLMDKNSLRPDKLTTEQVAALEGTAHLFL